MVLQTIEHLIKKKKVKPNQNWKHLPSSSSGFYVWIYQQQESQPNWKSFYCTSSLQ